MNIIRNGQLDIEANGYITGKKCGAFAYLSAPANTVITNAGDYSCIQGAFTASPAEDFSVASGTCATVQYNGTKTQYFRFHWQGSCTTDKATTTITVGFKVNGVLNTTSLQSSLMKNIGELYRIAVFGVIELSHGDTVEFVCSSSVGNTTFAFDKINSMVREFFD